MSARILIVDDTPSSIKMLAAKLSNEYYEVLTAGDGPAALEAVERDAPDIVLLDVMMPGMDGFEVCRRIKGSPQNTHIPVVMVTALGNNEDRVKGLEAGADDFLTKPVDDTTLFARIRSLVRLKHMLEQWRLRGATSEKLGFVTEAIDVLDSGTGADIVLVDDSTIQREQIIQFLGADNDRVTVIDDYEASGKVVDLGGDVVVISLSTDSDAPLRMASRLRSLDPTRQVPILLIGDPEDQDLFIKALELGINDYIMRPLDELELLARVRTQVRRKRYQDRLHEDFFQHLSIALTDSLTGLHNRRYLSTHLDSVMERMRESEKPVSLLMIDVDHFKQINDTYGHSVGDEVLNEIGQRILRNIRGFDLAARYGGEEFTVVMSDTPIEVALGVADRLCEKMANEPISVSGSKDKIVVTLSIGVSVSQGFDETAENLLKQADDFMYQAKKEGRNQVIPTPPKSAKGAVEALPG